MITQSETGNILYEDCTARYGDIVCQTLFTPPGKVESERIVIIPKPQQRGDVWTKSFAEVNWHVADMQPGIPDMIRLCEIEREMAGSLGSHGIHDGTPYVYRVESIEIKADEPLGSHYVNARVLFKVMNIN